MIIVVIPTLNEEKHISGIISETIKYVDKIIVVDSSSDKTSEIVSGFRDVVLLYESRRGKGLAVRKGISAAMKDSPDYIVMMDGDGERDPKQILNLLEVLQKNKSDLVLGKRDKMRSHRRGLLNNFGLWWINYLTGYELDDTFSGFIAFRREALEKLSLKSSSFEIETEIILESWKNNLKVSETKVGVPKISNSLCSKRDMISINTFFDKWVLKNIGNVPITKRSFLAVSCTIGLLISALLLRKA